MNQNLWKMLRFFVILVGALAIFFAGTVHLPNYASAETRTTWISEWMLLHPKDCATLNHTVGDYPLVAQVWVMDFLKDESSPLGGPYIHPSTDANGIVLDRINQIQVEVCNNGLNPVNVQVILQ